MTTIRDVASRAGVSISTVSRALNGVDGVDPVLAERARRAAAELGYRPNAAARNLRRGSATVWALIISDIESPFFTRLARGVEDVAHAAGYSVVLCNSDEEPAKEERYIAVAEQERVAGVILSPSSADCDLTRLAERGVPVVAVDRPLQNAAYDAVLVGSKAGARAATDHLLEQGWRRPACITGPERVETAQERLEGFAEALRGHATAAGREPDSLQYRYANFKEDGGEAAARSLLTSDDPPDALFIANSVMALGALRVLSELGLRLGADIGFVTFDDTSWASVLSPSVTVVAQPSYDLGAEAARLLLDRLSSGGNGAGGGAASPAGNGAAATAGETTAYTDSARESPSQEAPAGAATSAAETARPSGAAERADGPRTVLLETRLVVRDSSQRAG